MIGPFLWFPIIIEGVGTRRASSRDDALGAEDPGKINNTHTEQKLNHKTAKRYQLYGFLGNQSKKK